LLPARDIDRQIRVAGTPLPEPVMWLTFGGPNGGAPQPPPGTPRWRSITTVLSTTGRDMSRSEFIEFYARADAAGAIALVLDVGTVSEDAFFVAANGAVSGVTPEGRPWGIG